MWSRLSGFAHDRRQRESSDVCESGQRRSRHSPSGSTFVGRFASQQEVCIVMRVKVTEIGWLSRKSGNIAGATSKDGVRTSFDQIPP
jgi:hypothetical protein